MINTQSKHKMPKTAPEWLAYIEALHPKSIAMGLDRVQIVADNLQLKPNFPIITVAGTNGKGSVCAMLSQIYIEAGFAVACYTSPHLMRYNERVCINGQEILDDDLCTAFAAVEAARGDVALTYFEMGTLAAMWHFCRQNLDVCLLEVGLGGRLDAVNVFEPSCAIVTTVDLDHMEFLGDTREKIGFEKAGIFRANKPAIYGDENPPNSLINYAAQIGAKIDYLWIDFMYEAFEHYWNYDSVTITMKQLPLPALHGDFQLKNAACVLAAIDALQEHLPVPILAIDKGLQLVKLSGRFQQIHAKPALFVDVAHNPQAAKSLAQNLATTPNIGKTLAVFAMLADKDISGVVGAVKSHIDAWYLADIHAARGAKALDLQAVLNQQAILKPAKLFADVATALSAAYKDAKKNDRIIVFGSFYTAADAISWAGAATWKIAFHRHHY